MSADAECGFRGGVGGFVDEDRRIFDGFNQTAAEQRCRDAEDDVMLRDCRSEVWLCEVAGPRVSTSFDGEQSLDAATPNTVRRRIGKFESGFTNGPVGRHERRYCVCGAVFGGDLDLWIY